MPTLRWDPNSLCTRFLVTALAALAPAPAVANETGTRPFVVVNRTISQDQGDWQIDYRLRHAGPAGLTVRAEEVSVRVEGWVSNSRIPGHATPRRSSLTTSGPSGLQAVADVIASDDEEQRCRERAILKIWVDDEAGNPIGQALTSDGNNNGSGNRNGNGNDDTGTAPPILSLSPGTTFRVRLRLEHRHVVYGAYDPLLGPREVELDLGVARFSDALPLDREQYVAQPSRVAFDVPEDRRDTQYYVSAPDSLHLAAHIPGNAFFRFPEIPVRYGTKMRLRFSYLVAAGTEGACRARITQYKDSPIAWKVLADGRREELLGTVGRWTQVEILLRTEPDATTLALDFRIEGAEIEAGELWIDDVSLEPVGAAPTDP
jgi:hypothetical protein